MAKAYSPAPKEIVDRVARLIKQNYPALRDAGLTVCCLSVTNTEPSKPALNHGGYPALAVVRATGPKERVKGAQDAEITFDEMAYNHLKEPQRDALCDHELYHIDLMLDKAAMVKRDSRGRPRLRMRKHDYQFGWFSEIARRHGMNSMEALQAHRMYLAERQTFFCFIEDKTLEIESSEPQGAGE